MSTKPKKSQRHYIYERDGRQCRYCGKPLSLRQMTLDHYDPRGHGGATEVFNLVACCRRCNKEKYNRVPPDAVQVQIGLFQKAVADGIIRPDKSRIKEWDPARLEAVDTLYATKEGTFFQGGGYRYLVRRHSIIQMTRYHVHGD